MIQLPPQPSLLSSDCCCVKGGPHQFDEQASLNTCIGSTEFTIDISSTYLAALAVEAFSRSLANLSSIVSARDQKPNRSCHQPSHPWWLLATPDISQQSPSKELTLVRTPSGACRAWRCFIHLWSLCINHKRPHQNPSISMPPTPDDLSRLYNTLTSFCYSFVGRIRVYSLPSVSHPRLGLTSIESVIAQCSTRLLLGSRIRPFGAVGFGAQIGSRDGCCCDCC